MDVLRWTRAHGDAVLAAVLCTAFLLELAAWDGTSFVRTLPLVLLATVPLTWRRRQPVAVAIAVAASLTVLEYVLPGFDNDSASLVVVYLFNLYSLGRHASGRDMWAGAAVLAAVMVQFLLSDNNFDSLPDAGDVAFTLAFLGGPWALGLTLRLRQEREAALQQASREALTRQRATIARELHDVVSHAISVTVLQARGGRAMLGRDDDAAREAFDAIERTNTAALSDMRRLLAVLRDTDDGAEATGDDRAPQPTLGNLDRLVEQVRSAGLRVDLQVDGAADDVPPGVDLSAYRIVQEALTNVLKHAGSRASALIRVAYSPEDVVVSVTDDGRGPGDVGAGGRGLIGVQERVAVVGGEVEVGPAPSGGFSVRARLPFAFEEPR